MEVRSKLVRIVFILLCVGCSYHNQFGNESRVLLKDHPLPVGRRNLLWVVSADYQSKVGSLLQVNLSQKETSRQIKTAALPLSGDPIARVFSELPFLFVLNRFGGGDNIQIFNQDDLGVTVPQYSLSGLVKDTSSNLQDLAVYTYQGKTFGYVSALNSKALWKINPMTGQALVSLDLSGYAEKVIANGLDESDGLPEISHLDSVGEELWVALQRLDRGPKLNKMMWEPVDYSQYVIVDPVTMGVKGSLKLQGKNPVTNLKKGPGNYWYVGNRGGNKPGTGAGLERIDTAKYESKGIVVSEWQLGGTPFAFEFGDGVAWIAVMTESFGTRVVKFSIDHKGAFSSGVVLEETDALNPIRDILYDSDRHLIFVASNDRRTPGISVREAGSYKEVCFIDVGSRPLQLLWNP